MPEIVIRAARCEDLPAIVEMGAQFYATTDYPAIAPYGEVSAGLVGEMLLEAGVLLVAEAGEGLLGMVGLVVAPHIFNREVKTAHEVMWWVDPAAREAGVGQALLAAVEPACRAKGARAIQMLHLRNSPPAAAALYQRAGYAYSESSFTRLLT